ncbi:MAG: ribonuclease Y [Dehalococcoidia bacterium]|jgi:ribonuclease Y|nr:ribonuclease Y [Dehalococcoidia bacterium]
MPEGVFIALFGLLGIVGGIFVGAVIQYWLTRNRMITAERNAARLLNEAERRYKEIVIEAREEAVKIKSQAEAELKEQRNEIQRLERRLLQKEETLERKLEALERREQALAQREAQLEELKARLQKLGEERQRELERIAGLSIPEARQLILAQVEQEVREEASRRAYELEQRIKEEAQERARKILVGVMQRLTTDVVSEATVSVVPLPSEDMKGRIIGREGRNIRTLEHLTGVDVIIDDTPDAVTLSSFDPVRREVARIALTKLMSDGRIHPARIEEMVERAWREVDAAIREAGEQAAIEANCPGLHPEIIKLLGRLKYRYSYGQNQLKHAVETAHLAALIAHELGADVQVARLGGLLHDIGKAVDHEMEGTHARIGADMARKYGLPEAVVHCIEAHHEEVEPSTVEAVITIVADALSGGRPGARRESLEQYLRRLEALEALAYSLPGVEKAYAIQAGREIRVIVKPEEIDDLGAFRLARDLSRKIQETLQYPGQIKVTVIREKRVVEYAR